MFINIKNRSHVSLFKTGDFKMEKYEYKVVKLPLVGLGVFKKDIPENLQDTLNAEGSNGWRLMNSFVTASGFGESSKLVCIFMREIK